MCIKVMLIDSLVRSTFAQLSIDNSINIWSTSWLILAQHSINSLTDTWSTFDQLSVQMRPNVDQLICIFWHFDNGISAKLVNSWLLFDWNIGQAATKCQPTCQSGIDQIKGWMRVLIDTRPRMLLLNLIWILLCGDHNLLIAENLAMLCPTLWIC